MQCSCKRLMNKPMNNKHDKHIRKRTEMDCRMNL